MRLVKPKSVLHARACATPQTLPRHRRSLLLCRGRQPFHRHTDPECHVGRLPVARDNGPPAPASTLVGGATLSQVTTAIRAEDAKRYAAEIDLDARRYLAEMIRDDSKHHEPT